MLCAEEFQQGPGSPCYFRARHWCCELFAAGWVAVSVDALLPMGREDHCRAVAVVAKPEFVPLL